MEALFANDIHRFKHRNRHIYVVDRESDSTNKRNLTLRLIG